MTDAKEKKEEEGKDEKGRDPKIASHDAYLAAMRRKKGIKAPLEPESQAEADREMLENPSSAEAEGIAKAEEQGQEGDTATGTGET
jgi:hypothetical protein